MKNVHWFAVRPSNAWMNWRAWPWLAVLAVLPVSGCTVDGQGASAGSAGAGGSAGTAGAAARVSTTWGVGPLSESMNETLATVDPRLGMRQGCEENAPALREATAQRVSAVIDSLFVTYVWRCFPERYAHDYGYVTINGGGGTVSPLPENVSGDAPGEFTGTNNQVADVDEADLVKTDGRYLYLATDAGLRVISAWPPEETRELALVPVPGRARKLFLYEDRLLVYSSYVDVAKSGEFAASVLQRQGTECRYGYDCEFSGDGSGTVLQVYDVANPSAPRLLRELKASGSLIAARRIGAAIHTVLYDGRTRLPPIDVVPEALRGWTPELPDDVACLAAPTYEEADALFRPLHDAAKARVSELPLSELLPQIEDSVTGQRTSPCDGYYAPEAQLAPIGTSEYVLDPPWTWQGFTSVLSFDLHEATGPAQLAALHSRAGAVYASSDALYVGVRGETVSSGASGAAPLRVTALHKFDLRSGAARYVASGVAPGTVLNQFAIDEYAGRLRVAGSTGAAWSEGTVTAVTALEQQGAGLVRVGALSGLAPSEDVRSVRFDRERAFVVTFKKTDPLFLLDVSDPTRMRVEAELKVPGFSTYMQLMDDDHLLTIGLDAEDQGTFGWFQGVQLQIFDVTDANNPRLAHKELIGTRGTSSEALTDHLAFRYVPATGRLSLPMTVCENSAGGGSFGTDLTFSGLLVYRASADSGFEPLGRVAHASQAAAPGTDGAGESCDRWWTDAHSAVKRSLWFDDYVYSISGQALKVNHVDDLARDVAVVPLVN